MSEPSPLEKEIRRLIAVGGPMPIARYMSLCLTHPQYGYYVTRDPFGARRRFHHRAGSQPDIRRVARALGAVGLADDG